MEDLRSWSERLARFLCQYRWLLDAYVIEYFTEGHWGKLPSAWQGSLQGTCVSDIAQLLLSPPRQGHWRGTADKVYPLSLLAFVAAANSLSLPRWPAQYVVGETDRSRRLPQVAGLDHVFRRHVKFKKQHEIQNLAKEVMKVVRETGCKTILDIGSGQGHLARYLAYECGLKVVTVDAVGCHLAAAAKFDSEVERDILKKKKNEKLTSAVARDGGSIVHVQSVIQPDISPEELLSRLNVGTPSPSAPASPPAAAGAGPVSQPRFILVGLHTCGNLAPTLLRVFAESGTVVGVVSVGCCFMKLSCDGERTVGSLGGDWAENHGDRVCADPVRETNMWGYPMSRWLSGLPEELSRMSYEAREVACHSIDTYREKLSRESHHVKVHCHRAVVETILRKHGLRRSQVKLSRRESRFPFTEYATAVLKGLNLPLTHLESEREMLSAMSEEWREVAVFFMLRLALAPCVETLLLLDRLLFLTEQGYSANMRPVFDPTLSPRNQLLSSLK